MQVPHVCELAYFGCCENASRDKEHADCNMYPFVQVCQYICFVFFHSWHYLAMEVSEYCKSHSSTSLPSCPANEKFRHSSLKGPRVLPKPFVGLVRLHAWWSVIPSAIWIMMKDKKQCSIHQILDGLLTPYGTNLPCLEISFRYTKCYSIQYVWE